MAVFDLFSFLFFFLGGQTGNQAEQLGDLIIDYETAI